MPTTNPRVYVTLSPELDSLVGRMSALERISKSQLIREMLEAAQPTLGKACALMEAASKASKGARTDLADSLEHSQSVLEAELENMLQAVASHSGDLVSMAEEVRGRRPGKMPQASPGPVSPGPNGPVNPPNSKRGVKTSGKGVNRVPKTSNGEVLQ
jgi:hypothetical protein